MNSVIDEMRFNRSILVKALVAQCLALACIAQDFDFFFFTQQWPGSYCDSSYGCCYPITGKPEADFGIHGLWPNFSNGTYPFDCDTSNPFNYSQIEDLSSRMQKYWPTLKCRSGDGLEFWAHEWNKHGTCSESTFDQHSYFDAALNLRNKSKLLQALTNAGIRPVDGEFYRLDKVKEAIKNDTGFEPFITCNVDMRGNNQLFEVYVCVDASATNFIECPYFPQETGCESEVEFPTFSGNVTHQQL